MATAIKIRRIIRGIVLNEEKWNFTVFNIREIFGNKG
jgi:hypothetical protein